MNGARDRLPWQPALALGAGEDARRQLRRGDGEPRVGMQLPRRLLQHMLGGPGRHQNHRYVAVRLTQSCRQVAQKSRLADAHPAGHQQVGATADDIEGVRTLACAANKSRKVVHRSPP